MSLRTLNKVRVAIGGRHFEMRLELTVDEKLAAKKLAERMAKTGRKRAVMCFGAIKAEQVELQEIIP